MYYIVRLEDGHCYIAEEEKPIPEGASIVFTTNNVDVAHMFIKGEVDE